MTAHIPEARRLQIDEHGTSTEGYASTPNGGHTQSAQKGSYCIWTWDSEEKRALTQQSIEEGVQLRRKGGVYEQGPTVERVQRGAVLQGIREPVWERGGQRQLCSKAECACRCPKKMVCI